MAGPGGDASTLRQKRRGRTAPSFGIPQGKLRPPGLPATYVSRGDLCDRLDEALEKRLTVVIAGPGFGKSTLLASWAEDVRSAWYSVTAEDRELLPFVRGISGALDAVLGELPVDVAAALRWPGGPGADDASRAEALATLLAVALDENTTDDLVLVVDDVHELAAGKAPARLLAALVRQAPATLHVVVATRSAPPFRLERLRGRGQVLEIDASQLAFSVDDVHVLLEGVLEDASEPLARELHQLTAGWPAAVRLGAEALRDVPVAERSRTLARLRRPEGPLFPYLAEEVFGPSGRAARELVRRVALFDRFTPELCAEVGVSSAGPALSELVRRGLFVQVQRGAGGWLSLHALAREFVLERWPLDETERQDLLRRAATWFQANGDLEQALETTVAAGEASELARFLVECGPDLLAQGAVHAVLRAIDALPAEERTQDLEVIAGQALQIRGNWDGAFRAFERASEGVSRLPPRVAWRMGVVHYLRGEIEEALAVYESALGVDDELREQAMLLAWAATARWVRGELETARELGERAFSLATEANDHQALAAAHTVLAMLTSIEGDPAARDRHDTLALEHAELAGDVLQMVRIRANRGGHLADEAQYEQAIAELDDAVRLAEVAGFANFHALALSNRGEARVRLGELDEALVDLEASRDLYQRLESRARGYPLAHLGELHRERGELATARATYEEAVEVMEAGGDVQGLVPALSGLARVLAAEDVDGARAAVERALSHTGFARVDALLAAGWVALAVGERDRAESAAEEALAEARQRRNPAGLAEALELRALAASDPERSAAWLEEARSICREIGNRLAEARVELALGHFGGADFRERAANAEQRLHGLGVRTHPPLPAGTLAMLPRAEEPAVAVRTLGGFGVMRDGSSIALTEWQSKKARDLLKLLVARRGRPVTRDALMEALWPEEDPGKVANRLSVALATLRSVLDPGRQYPPDHFVRASEQGLAVVLANVLVDFEVFLAAAEAGLGQYRNEHSPAAVPTLERAEKLYTGDFLEEDVYEEWAVGPSEEARATYVAVAHALAEVARARGDPESSIRYCLRILERDTYDERANLTLVASLTADGRHGDARRAYQRYVRRMEDIGVEPAPFPERQVALSPS